MKVLFVNFTDIFGGGEVFLKNILLDDKYKDIKKILITPKSEKIEKGLNGVKVIHGYSRSEKFISINNFKSMIKQIRLINRVILEEKIDCIFLNGRNSYYLSSFLSKNVKKIGVWHGSNLINTGLRKVLNLISFNALDKIMVMSNNQKEQILSKFGTKYNAKVKVIYLGIKIEKKPIINKQPNRVLIVARLERLKGHLDLIKAIEKLKDKFKDIKLIIVGEGDESKNISDEIKRLDLERYIEMRGFIDPNKEYSLASIVVLPSYSEAFPLVNLEAMAYEIPVISTNVGGVEEAVIHGVNGYIIKPGDIDALVRYIELLLNNNDIRKRMGKEGRKMVSSMFTIDIMRDKVYRLIKEVI